MNNIAEAEGFILGRRTYTTASDLELADSRPSARRSLQQSVEITTPYARLEADQAGHSSFVSGVPSNPATGLRLGSVPPRSPTEASG